MKSKQDSQKKDGMVSKSELTPVVERASFLWERLDSQEFEPDLNVDSDSEAKISEKLERWCQVVSGGDWEKLERRWQWDCLTGDRAKKLLGNVKWRAGSSLPQWTETLKQIIEISREFDPKKYANLPIEVEEPLPFEELWLPVLMVARNQLQIKLPDVLGLLAEQWDSYIDKNAYYSLERRLLKQLTHMGAKTLDAEFAKVRPAGSGFINKLLQKSPKNRQNTTHYYDSFIWSCWECGWGDICQKYPVLGRLVATTVNLWVDATVEFIQRLLQDYEKIQQTFCKSVESSLGRVAEIETGLSDPHNGGRTVLVLAFELGVKIVYKPKNMGLDVGWNELLAWCQQQDQRLDCKTLKLLHKEEYGWVEYVEQQPCQDEAGAKRFYQRAGMLLCLLYILQGSDCHKENIIASGEHLVVVDLETLLVPEVAKLIADSLNDGESMAGKLLYNSVLSTGLLPKWMFDNDRAIDISGLGSIYEESQDEKVRGWQGINTDGMYWGYETYRQPEGQNIPRLGERTLYPRDYIEELVSGFEQMYSLFMAEGESLQAVGGPLAYLQNRPIRFVFRDTKVYYLISQNALVPDRLKDGVSYSIELDFLSRVFLVDRSKPKGWPLLAAELKSMAQLDIPYFQGNSSSDALPLASGQNIIGAFSRTGYEQVVLQLQQCSSGDLARQISFIRGAFSARVARENQVASLAPEAPAKLLTPDELIGEARAIAREIKDQGIPDPDGRIDWIGIELRPEGGQFELQVFSETLYNGKCGIALFLSALDSVTGSQEFREFTGQTLQPLRKLIGDRQDCQRLKGHWGIGGAGGVSSVVYTLTKIGQFWGDAALLEDARVLANSITTASIAKDKKLDILNGASGAILGLLPLYEMTGDAAILSTMKICAEHLLEHRVATSFGQRSWQTIGSRPLTGFPYGPAGMGYALLRLYAVTGEANYREAALEAIAYEGSVFSPAAGNWPDFRTGGREKHSFSSSWCHGAPGIALGRLGCLPIVDTAEIRQDIEVALQTTQKIGLEGIDTLCCGNFGRIEILLVAARQLSRPELASLALQQATTAIARAKQTGSYQLFANLPGGISSPGFFQGTAGIGYELLRLVDNSLPSVLLWQ